MSSPPGGGSGGEGSLLPRVSGSATAVEVDRLEHRYGERPALRGVSFAVARGEIFGLLGPNGGGKTTLFRILATILRPSAGTARIFGRDVRAERAAVRERIGVVFQSPSLDKKLTAEENLTHQGHLYGMRGSILRARVAEMLGLVGLADRAKDYVEKLSGGQRRRVELAKGLLHRPEVVLLDEPSTGLDPAARRDLMEHLRRLRKEQGITVLLTTHIMEEADGCDRLAVLNEGMLVAEGTPESLKERIGGDVITIGVASEPARLAEEIRARFGAEAKVLEGATGEPVLRLERTRGPAFVPELFEAFQGRIASVQVGRPTLEDVFIRETGRRL